MFRKQSPAASSTLPWTNKSESSSKLKETHNYNMNYNPHIIISTTQFSTKNDHHNKKLSSLLPNKTKHNFCDGNVSVFVYDLPSRFNLGLLAHCENLNIYTNMCPHVANHGLGKPIRNYMGGLISSGTPSWFATHQFIAEMIFHARVENHACRTWDPDEADVFYVPFYGGLHASSMFREANHTLRDALAVDLIEYLRNQPWWRKRNGRDHFLALGRTAWDFMRTQDGPGPGPGPGHDFGANRLLNLPHVRNMSVLTVERHPWKGSNQYGIPYPSYFHPAAVSEMEKWQQTVRESERPHLFSFVGGPRKGLEKAAIRAEILRQCEGSARCALLKCGDDGGGMKCHSPSAVLDVMTRSQFCLQAPGDSFTRRSTFDAVLAGCIPVFFSRHTAYSQYAWYLPERTTSYSVLIDEKGKGSRTIEEELLKIPREKVKRMREVVINMIPRLTYAHPNATDVGFKDAVDVALVHLSRVVQAKVNDGDGDGERLRTRAEI
ncbi:putative xyloglucan galactosyltransferase GT17 [Senna tora]|uniref:Putative xyloglucan galactosyltransferase GT17 n=1 Tax=Senna tora TaxID=362788 RepID=A0A834TVR6_9FABA|nr:putative xyloglucan galactosyltransferase GT17 [Senna tora]